VKYWQIFFLLFLVLFIGVYTAADSLNEQLSCQAAPVIDVQVVEDNVQLSVLNSSCSFNIPPVIRNLADHPQVYEIWQKSNRLLKKWAWDLREKAVVFGQEVYSLGQVIWNNFRNKLGSGEG
jgi:hypothetical protein